MTDRELLQQALDALEAALSDDQPYIVRCKQTVETLRTRLAQPEPEPVAWFEQSNSGEWFLAYGFNSKANTKPLYKAPPKKEWGRSYD